MKTEAVPLTQQASTTYAREGVIFMATTESTDTEQGKSEQEQDKTREQTKTRADNPEVAKKAHEKAKKVQEELKAHLEKTFKGTEIPETADGLSNFLKDHKEDISPQEIHTWLEKYSKLLDDGDMRSNAELRKLRREYRKIQEALRDIDPHADEIVQGKTGSFDEQLLTQFGQYLGIKIKPDLAEGTRVDTTSDGVETLHVAKNIPLDQLVALAQQMYPEQFSAESKSNIAQFGEDLQNAALWMDQQAFGPDVIKRIYNQGMRLQHVVEQPDKPLPPEKSYEEIFKLDHSENITQEQRTQGFINIIMGRHTLATEVSHNNLYDVYFRRWEQEQLFENDAEYQDIVEQLSKLSEHDERREEWQNKRAQRGKKLLEEDLPRFKQAPLSERQQQYDAYLRENNAKMAGWVKRFVEKAEATGKFGRLGARAVESTLQQDILQAMVGKWQEAVDKTPGGVEMTRAIREELEKARVEKGEDLGTEDQLRIVTEFFQPKGATPAKALKYVPAEILDLFGKNDEQRNLAACAIAAGYEMHVLQSLQGLNVTSDLSGAHATLWVRDAQGEIFAVDPSKPFDPEMQQREENKAVEKFEQNTPDKVRFAQELQRFLSGEQAAKTLRIQINGTWHVIGGKTLITSELIGNLAALDSKHVTEEYVEKILPQNMASEDLQELQFALAKKAVDMAPDNYVAWAQMGNYATDGRKDEYLNYARTLNRDGVEEARRKELLVGNWTRPRGLPAEANGTLNYIESVLNDPARVQDIYELDDQQLRLAMESLDQGMNLLTQRLAQQNPRPPQAQIEFDNMQEFSRRLHTAYYAKADRGDIIQSFNLTPNESAIFAGSNIAAMKRKLDDIIYFFGEQQNTGFLVTTEAAQIAHGKISDIIKLLGANPDIDRDLEIREIFNLASEQQHIIIGPYQAAALMESGNADKYVQAAEQLNGMDSAGGWDTIAALRHFGDGRAGIFANEMFRIMDWWRQKNAHFNIDENGNLRVSVGNITFSDYKKIRNYLIDRYYTMAVPEAGSGLDPTGPYVDVRAELQNREGDDFEEGYIRQHPKRPGESDTDFTRRVQDARDTYINDEETQKKINNRLKTHIRVEANFGHAAFSCEGRHKEMLIRGENNLEFEPNVAEAPEMQNRDLQRWAEMTKGGQEYVHELLSARMEEYVRIRYGDAVVEKLMSSYPGAFDRIVRQMGFDMAMHYAKGFRQNEYLFVRPNLYSGRKWWEHHFNNDQALTAQQVKDRVSENADGFYDQQFQLFYMLHAPNSVVKPGAQHISERAEHINPVVQYILSNPEYYSKTIEDRLRATYEEQADTYKINCARYGLMDQVIARLYPDELMKPFALEPDFYEAEDGSKFDPRFIDFFGRRDLAFLDDMFGDTVREKAEAAIEERFNDSGAPEDRSYYSRMSEKERDAHRRFYIFQEYVTPLLTSIRTASIEGMIFEEVNGVEVNTGKRKHNPNDPNERYNDPKQVDFGQRRFKEFGVNAENIRKMMAAMTAALKEPALRDAARNPNPTKNSLNLIGRLAFDPSMMHVLYYSSLSMVDAPDWMLHGKDPFMQDHPSDITENSGGSDQVGRPVAYVKDSQDARKNFVLALKGDPNHFEETMFKPYESVSQTNYDFIGKEFAIEGELAIKGRFMDLMTAKVAELVGAESRPMKDSWMREHFGSHIRSLTKEQKETIIQTMEKNLLRRPYFPEHMRRFANGKKLRRWLTSLWKILLANIIIAATEVVTTGGSAIQQEFQ